MSVTAEVLLEDVVHVMLAMHCEMGVALMLFGGKGRSEEERGTSKKAHYHELLPPPPPPNPLSLPLTCHSDHDLCLTINVWVRIIGTPAHIDTTVQDVCNSNGECGVLVGGAKGHRVYNIVTYKIKHKNHPIISLR